MKNIMSALALLALMVGFLSSLARDAAGSSTSSQCPDTKATQVDAEIVLKGDVTTCGVGVSVFGLHVGVFGPKCPDVKLTYPSHQECQGELNEYTYCQPRGNMDVTKEKCECVTVTVLGFGALVPSCSCSDAGTGGHVEDATTVACPGHP